MAHRSSKALQNAASVLNVHNSQTDAKSQVSLRHSPRILVNDPPCNQLSTGPPEDSAFLLTRFPGHLVNTSGSPISIYITPGKGRVVVQKSPRCHRLRMAKKRRSLQSLFIPSFLTASSSPTITMDVFSANTGRARSYSMATQPYDYLASNGAEPSNSTQTPSPLDLPPPEFLLDDDPFANLSTVSAFITPSPTLVPTPITPLETSSSVQTPRSPLTPQNFDTKLNFPSPPPISRQSLPGISRTLSGRARPAYSKPAFAPRPSLPSLDSLARMNIVLPRKVRKGRVGAKLPFEPWDQLDASRSSEESSTISQEASVQGSPHNISTDIVSGPDSSEPLKENSDNDTTCKEEGPLTSASQEPETFVRQDESPCSADSEASLDSLDSLDDNDCITSSELSYLSRSTSTASSSFSISSPIHLWPCFSNPNDDSSSAEDSDTSSPDDFSFSDSYFDSHNIISSYWSSDDLLDSLSGDISTSALYSELSIKSDMNLEPGTSIETIRPSTSTERPDMPFSPQIQTPVDVADELVDGSGRENVHGGASFGGKLEQNGSNVRRASGNNGSGRTNGSSTNRSGGRGDDEDEDGKRRRINNSKFSTPSESEASVSDEDSTDDYGESAPMKAPSSSSDDDVPLAQCIPNALKAQNTIRRQVQEEREQRRAARAAAAARARSSSTPRGVVLSTRPPGTGEPSQRAPISSSQEAASHASKSLRHVPPKALPTSVMQPFSPEDLTRRLQNMETSEPSSSTTQFSRSTRREASRPRSAGHGMKDPTSPVLAISTIGPSSDHRTLRPSRSFHRPGGRRSEEHHAVPLPIDAGRKLARSFTRREDDPSTSPGSFSTRIQDENSRPSLPRRTGEEPRRLTKYPEPRSARSSSEMERPRRSSPTPPPVPPLPLDAFAISTSPPTARGLVIQQRVFIGDMQRFNMVEIGPSTNAGDVIEMVEAQGSLKGWAGSGNWMVWEVAQDFGMERPIRSFELLSDVQASWNKDKLMNTFVIKLTPLAVPLSRSAIPSASPMHAGYVEWEIKRGKWNKRWLQLREHCLWLSKRDNGRDEVLLCSLSNFDAYFITRLHKAPRPFSFAVKSTDKLSFFENTADYLHIFSCGEKEGAAWVEHILLARSYVLYQERNILFNPKAAGSAGTLSRAVTRKASSAHRPVAQPLISGVTAPMTITQQLQSSDVFEPGSLLRKHV
ncbi:hypothetical protein C0989_011976 [Termitomyces sp. Mn162]|nr:hypothetical protein C0989_011976 [Termitomyces sp. Mn162]